MLYPSPTRQKASSPNRKKPYLTPRKSSKRPFFHLAEVEKRRKNAKAALAGLEKQAEELQVFLKKSKTQLALAMEKTKQ